MYEKVGTAFLTTLFIFSSFTSANAEEKKDSKAFIDVSAATLWTTPDSLRPIDAVLQIQLICGSGRNR